MEIALTPDTYVPVVDDSGRYSDKIPIIKNGLYCPCGATRDKVYQTQQFRSHIKSKSHQKWLQTLNNNKTNHYAELLDLREIVSQQKIQLVRLENQLGTKSLTIDMLTEQLALIKNNYVPTADLLTM